MRGRSGGRDGRRSRSPRAWPPPPPCWNCSTTARTCVVCDDLYGGTYRLFERVRRRSANLDFTYVNPADLTAFRGGHSPQHPDAVDRNPVESAAEAGRPGRACRNRPAAGTVSVADNTFATPYCQRPMALGFDIVVHSVTKYLNGHSDMVGGAVVGDNAELVERLQFLQNAVGGRGRAGDARREADRAAADRARPGGGVRRADRGGRSRLAAGGAG